METTATKAPLVKKFASYKIIIPASVERTIRFLCERVWDTEWSGILFYNPTGSFEDGSLEIHCVDIYPMDIGSTGYTEFDMSPDVISYMAQNPELLDCKTGLIHSHNNMATFFSGTDLNTLRDEGNDQVHFVSLIVNNAGNYTAAITRKIRYHSLRKISYEGYSDVISITEPEEENGEEVEYFDLKVVFEEERDTKFKDIAERLSDIKSKKKASPYTSSYNHYKGSGSPIYIPSVQETPKKQVKEPTLFDDSDFGSSPASSISTVSSTTPGKVGKATDKDIKKIITQLLTGSVTVTNVDASTKDKLVKTIDKRFDARFGKSEEGMLNFECWANDFVDFLLWYSIPGEDLDECKTAKLVAEMVLEALGKLPVSKYLDKYDEIITKHVSRLD